MSDHELITTRDALLGLASALEATSRIAVDLEANGRFAYRARLCTLQLAWDERVAIVDCLSPELSGILPLAGALGKRGPVKVVHDVAFDARMLAEEGVELARVHDTAIAAQWLGRAATGLASLASTELGVTLDKKMQGHDWGARPLQEAMRRYLSEDVIHLGRLDDKLWEEVRAQGIEAEVYEETEYRLACALQAVRSPDPRPPYIRIKGVDRLAEPALAVVRRLAEAREREAQRLDVPSTELVPSAALLSVAQARPTSLEALRRMRFATARCDSLGVARALFAAVEQGVADGQIPEGERRWLERPRVPQSVAKQRRAKETRLFVWRKAEAERRKVHEQVVLPGHCVKALVEMDDVRIEDLASVGGLGAFRIARDGDALVRVLHAD